MKLPREPLAEHLRRIRCGEMVGVFILEPDLSCTALGRNQVSVVDSDSPDFIVEPLARSAIGVSHPMLLIKILESASGPKVELDVEDDPPSRLRVGVMGGEYQLLVGGEDQVMKKRVGAKMKKNLRTTAADGEAAKLPAKVRTEILEAIKILGSLEVEVIAGPEGTLFRIGSEAGNHRELLWDGYQSEEIYRLYLTSYNIERVLRQAEQFAPDRTEIVFTGPDSPVAVSVGSYTYYLNPVAECKEEDPSYEPAVSSVQSKI